LCGSPERKRGVTRRRYGNPDYVFAGGGTGGHLYPGIALANELDGETLFLCTERPFDRGALEAAGQRFECLSSPMLGPSFPLRFGKACSRALKILEEVRPRVVIGLGGYGAVPAAVAAVFRGIPFVLLEQNIVPGKANRLLANLARRVYVQWEGTAMRGRLVATGSPLRSRLRKIPRGEACRRLGLDPDKRVVLILGGSQGAAALNRLEVPAQTLRIAGRGKSAPGDVVLEYLEEMEVAYSAADLAVSRAGAMAIAELAFFSLPTILVPYPHAAGDHQRANARALGDAVRVVEEGEIDLLPDLVAKLVSGGAPLHNMGRALGKFARPDAARLISEDLARI
jgi:UDP-N-acetylglucosamine--N-acetylmuramyl-(pentapeptide) pyrophosphoryl-undecaprenol N-acetylglucosamine transferase